MNPSKFEFCLENGSLTDSVQSPSSVRQNLDAATLMPETNGKRTNTNPRLERLKVHLSRKFSENKSSLTVTTRRAVSDLNE